MLLSFWDTINSKHLQLVPLSYKFNFVEMLLVSEANNTVLHDLEICPIVGHYETGSNDYLTTCVFLFVIFQVFTKFFTF
jgi:hypothetical protein